MKHTRSTDVLALFALVGLGLLVLVVAFVTEVTVVWLAAGFIATLVSGTALTWLACAWYVLLIDLALLAFNLVVVGIDVAFALISDV